MISGIMASLVVGARHDLMVEDLIVARRSIKSEDPHILVIGLLSLTPYKLHHEAKQYTSLASTHDLTSVQAASTLPSRPIPLDRVPDLQSLELRHYLLFITSQNTNTTLSRWCGSAHKSN